MSNFMGGSDFEVLHDVLDRLECARIDYVLTGSVVMNYCSVPRSTRDFDVAAEIGVNRIDDVVALFKDYDISRDAVRDAVLRSSSFNLIHPETITKIDIIIPKNREFHASLMGRRRKVELYPGVFAWAPTCEDLVLAKLMFSVEPPNSLTDPSPYQLKDVAVIVDAHPMDTAYIEGWVHRLGLEPVWRV